MSKKMGHIEFMCQSLDKDKITNINKELLTVDWTYLNNTDMNIALEEFQNKIENTLDTMAPLKSKKIPIHKIWQEQWITKGISKFNEKMYPPLQTKYQN